MIVFNSDALELACESDRSILSAATTVAPLVGEHAEEI